MKTVHKHEIPIDSEYTDLAVPEGANILTVEYLVTARSIFIWVEVPANLVADKNIRRFKVFKSGDGIPEKYQHIGTTLDQYLPEAYHVYEVPVD